MGPQGGSRTVIGRSRARPTRTLHTSPGEKPTSSFTPTRRSITNLCRTVAAAEPLTRLTKVCWGRARAPVPSDCETAPLRFTQSYVTYTKELLVVRGVTKATPTQTRELRHDVIVNNGAALDWLTDLFTKAGTSGQKA
ncbi:hypothetical protein EVAR_48538_1 [Eumeta japonica]|uniref:Uncharacterized protein n=1 Tax=Eumeta variegata TaxID=151549 RepID=A0A4C1YCH3_EUMVA|nr:hypothetical protein EVAR_48538_1 [Eumeta japonica]